jgi:hypothetical protein
LNTDVRKKQATKRRHSKPPGAGISGKLHSERPRKPFARDPGFAPVGTPKSVWKIAADAGGSEAALRRQISGNERTIQHNTYRRPEDSRASRRQPLTVSGQAALGNEKKGVSSLVPAF